MRYFSAGIALVAGLGLLTGCGIQSAAPANPPTPAPHTQPKAPPTPRRRSTPAHPAHPLPTPKVPTVGTTTVTTHTVGSTTTITKTVVVGSTTTSTVQPLGTDALPTAAYTAGQTFVSQGTTPQAAFDAVWTTRHRTPPAVPVSWETVTVPWAPHTQWTIDPEAIADPEAGGAIFWAGISTQPDHWTWIPSDTATVPNPALPLPLRDGLQWAMNLALNAPHTALPGLGGNIPWSTIAGRVGKPVGWSWVAYDGSLNLDVWDPSQTIAHVYDAPWSIWTAANAQTGDHALDQLIANHGPLAAVVHVITPA